MRLILVLIIIVSGCASLQTPQVQAPEPPSCPEPPAPPPPPLTRAATSFFEIIAMHEWAESYLRRTDQLPSSEEILDHLYELVLAIHEIELAAADARAYHGAEDAMLDIEELLLHMLELGAELPAEVRLPRSVINDGGLNLSQNPRGRMLDVLETISDVANNSQHIAIEIAEVQADNGIDRSARKEAECLVARLYAYTDLEDIVRMLEEDIEHIRRNIQHPDDEREIDLLQRELVFARQTMAACEAGIAESRTIAERIISSNSGGMDDLIEIEDIARGILEFCR